VPGGQLEVYELRCQLACVLDVCELALAVDSRELITAAKAIAEAHDILVSDATFVSDAIFVSDPTFIFIEHHEVVAVAIAAG